VKIYISWISGRVSQSAEFLAEISETRNLTAQRVNFRDFFAKHGLSKETIPTLFSCFTTHVFHQLAWRHPCDDEEVTDDDPEVFGPGLAEGGPQLLNLLGVFVAKLKRDTEN
jgi:hypothetical protein